MKVQVLALRRTEARGEGLGLEGEGVGLEGEGFGLEGAGFGLEGEGGALVILFKLL